MGRRGSDGTRRDGAPTAPPPHPVHRALTVVERLGPCQQPVPCSYFMALNLSWSGPAHEPHVLWESGVCSARGTGGRGGVAVGLGNRGKEGGSEPTHPRLVGDPPSLGFCETSLKGQSR